ncbi:hypothetical protein [Catelliglobosispora koreensis]|uniref:hypothetical protein n=1 Tax=Catelliglobosispora koreensis TaxID=129052 RepID=UPI000371BC57|nr:hypothetical protein [Catelliglobosispora koreensis]
MQPEVSGTTTASPLAESARGWQNIQLAVMGFIGFCGVLKMGTEQAGPEWLGWWSTGMSVLALITSVFSTWMVGSVAFPTLGAEAQMPPSAPGRLKSGIVMTFISVAMMALAGAAGWWPSSGDNIKVTAQDGEVACGTKVDGAPAGQLWLETADGTVRVNLSGLADMEVVGSCE